MKFIVIYITLFISIFIISETVMAQRTTRTINKDFYSIEKSAIQELQEGSFPINLKCFPIYALLPYSDKRVLESDLGSGYIIIKAFKQNLSDIYLFDSEPPVIEDTGTGEMVSWGYEAPRFFSISAGESLTIPVNDKIDFYIQNNYGSQNGFSILLFSNQEK